MNSLHLAVTPRGPGHFLNGLTVTSNVFRTVGSAIDRIEMADTSYAALNYQSFRNVTFADNTFHGISQPTISALLSHLRGVAWQRLNELINRRIHRTASTIRGHGELEERTGEVSAFLTHHAYLCESL